MRTIRPLYSTIVDPQEYHFDKQMEAWLEDANKHQACFHDIDVGKLWGLYLAFKEQQKYIAELENAARLVVAGDEVAKKSHAYIMLDTAIEKLSVALKIKND